MGVDFRRSSHLLLFGITMPLLSMALAWVSFALVGLTKWQYAFTIDGLGVLGAYAILFRLFDSCCWKWSLWRALGIVNVPMMAGRWTGVLKPLASEVSRAVPVAVEIQQTFSRAKVFLYGEQSNSWSLMAQFITEEDGSVALHYEYQNWPHVDSVETMYAHVGTARLMCPPDVKKLRGDYFTRSRDGRGNAGVLDLKYEGASLLRRFK